MLFCCTDVWLITSACNLVQRSDSGDYTVVFNPNRTTPAALPTPKLPPAAASGGGKAIGSPSIGPGADFVNGIRCVPNPTAPCSRDCAAALCDVAFTCFALLTTHCSVYPLLHPVLLLC